LCCLLLSGTGCANFWEEALSQERDWSYATGWGKPDPLTVLHDNLDHTPGADGLRRAQALGRLNEPLQNGGTAKDQQLYLDILGAAAKQDSEPLCRLNAVRALGRFKDPRAARILEEVYQMPVRKPGVRDDGNVLIFTQENNSMIRMQALVALENTRDPEARHLMVRVARQPGPLGTADLTDKQQTQDDKIVAIRALGKYPQKECVDALAYVMRTEKDIALRDRALQSLQESTGKRWPLEYTAWQRENVEPLPGDPNGTFIERVGHWVPSWCAFGEPCRVSGLRAKTGRSRGSARLLTLRRPHERLEVGNGGRLVHAVIQIDDMPAAAAGLHACLGRGRHLPRRAGAQHFFIDVALEHEIWKVAPRRRQIVADAEADDVGAA
jgi:hypothetical protein